MNRGEVVFISLITTLLVNALLFFVVYLFQGNSLDVFHSEKTVQVDSLVSQETEISPQPAQSVQPSQPTQPAQPTKPAELDYATAIIGSWTPTESYMPYNLLVTKFGVIKVTARIKYTYPDKADLKYQIKGKKLIVTEDLSFEGSFPIKMYQEGGKTYLEIYESQNLCGLYRKK